MPEYIILESKLNYLSDEELENSNTLDVTQCISRLEKIYQKENSNYRNRIIRNALRVNREQKPMRHKGMYFNNCTGSW